MAHPEPETPTQILEIVMSVPAEEVAEANRDAGPEERVASEGALSPVGTEGALVSDFSLEDDGHDDTVDGDGLTEDYTA